MKKILLPIYIIFLISSCGSKSDDSAKQKELELKAKELELKEKELEQKKTEETSSKDEVSEESKASESQTNVNNPAPQPRKKTEDELGEELYNKEISNPSKYLSLDYDLKYKVFSGKQGIKGTIYNYATIAGYKDVTIQVEYQTYTKSVISTERYLVSDYVYAGKSIPFDIKTYSPTGTKYIAVYVINAKNAY